VQKLEQNNAAQERTRIVRLVGKPVITRMESLIAAIPMAAALAVTDTAVVAAGRNISLPTMVVRPLLKEEYVEASAPTGIVVMFIVAAVQYSAAYGNLVKWSPPQKHVKNVKVGKGL